MYKPTIRLQVNILVLPSNFATYNHNIQSAACTYSLTAQRSQNPNAQWSHLTSSMI